MELIKAKRLDDSNFKNFGWTMRKPDRGADAENEQLAYWDHCADLTNFTGNGLLGFLEVKRIPIELKMMDLLTESLRIYLSIDGRPSVQFVALNDAASNQPDLATLQAFILEEGDGVVIDKEIWHWTPFALTEKASFAMGIRNDIMSACNGTYTVDGTKVKYFTLAEPLGVSF
jgi:ureidoglycolate hydrolase